MVTVVLDAKKQNHQKMPETINNTHPEVSEPKSVRP
jgi:hypothetical protein